MSILWVSIGLLTCVAVLALVSPLLHRRPAERVADAVPEVAIYKDQLRELDRDRARGLISEAEVKGARVEVERRLLRAAARTDPTPVEERGRSRLGLVAAAIVAPGLALGLYAYLGSPTAPDLPLAARAQPGGGGTPQVAAPQIAAMVKGLQERLAANPDDLEGWLMLGRSKAVLGDDKAAVEAYRKAAGVAPRDPRAVGALAQALVTAANGIVTPEARTQFAALAKIAPDDLRAPFFEGLARSQAGDLRGALASWRQVLAATPREASWRGEVEENVRQAAGDLRIDPAPILAAAPSAAPAAPELATPEAAAVAAMSPDDQKAFIKSKVDGLEARLEADGKDPVGWQRLAQAKLVLGDPEAARQAYEQGLRQNPDAPGLLQGYAASLLGPAQKSTGLPTVGDKARDLFARAADLAPDDPEPLWFLGVRALQDGDQVRARAIWKRALDRVPPDRPDYAALKARLDALGG